MKITMSDGRKITLTRITSTITSGVVLQVWQAEAAYPVHKLSATFTRAYKGFGNTQEEAIARLYEELDDAGELNDSLLPCPDCGRGYRILSVSDSFIAHAGKCPGGTDAEGD